MRKHLLPPDRNWYRANFHCHSHLSDGYWPPARLRDEYKRAGYQILAITDHNVLVDHSDLNDPDFLTLTSVEYDITDWDSRLPVARPDANVWNYRFHDTFHLNLFSKVPNPAGPPARDTIWGVQHNCFEGTEEEKARKKPFSLDAVNEVVAKANEAGFLVQYNHPNWSRNVRSDWLGLKGIWSLEILNYATECLTGGEYCPYVYDDLLNHVSPRIFCTMGDDNHNRDGTTLQSFGGSTIRRLHARLVRLLRGRRPPLREQARRGRDARRVSAREGRRVVPRRRPRRPRQHRPHARLPRRRVPLAPPPALWYAPCPWNASASSAGASTPCTPGIWRSRAGRSRPCRWTACSSPRPPTRPSRSGG